MDTPLLRGNDPIPEGDCRRMLKNRKPPCDVGGKFQRVKLCLPLHADSARGGKGQFLHFPKGEWNLQLRKSIHLPLQLYRRLLCVEVVPAHPIVAVHSFCKVR